MINNVIITELRVKPCSYASMVAAPGPANESSAEGFDCTEKQIVSFLWTKGIEVDYQTVEACHMPSKR